MDGVCAVGREVQIIRYFKQLLKDVHDGRRSNVVVDPELIMMQFEVGHSTAYRIARAVVKYARLINDFEIKRTEDGGYIIRKGGGGR